MATIRQTLSLDQVHETLVRRIDLGKTLRNELENLPQNAAADWCRQNVAFLKQSFEEPGVAERCRVIGPSWMIEGPPATKDKTETLGRLRDHIHEHVQVLEDIEKNIKEADRKKVFIVHGHDTGAREEVARFITALGLDPVILVEQPNYLRALIDKFESYVDVAYTVVLLTPDDVGGLRDKPDELLPRARQNVILEMGFFIAKLGRNRVCALVTEGVEQPSDIHGVAYTVMDKRGAWKAELAREIYDADRRIDLKALIGRADRQPA